MISAAWVATTNGALRTRAVEAALRQARKAPRAIDLCCGRALTETVESNPMTSDTPVPAEIRTGYSAAWKFSKGRVASPKPSVWAEWRGKIPLVFLMSELLSRQPAGEVDLAVGDLSLAQCAIRGRNDVIRRRGVVRQRPKVPHRSRPPRLDQAARSSSATFSGG